MYISTSSSWSRSGLTHCNAIDAKTFLDEAVGLIHAVQSFLRPSMYPYGFGCLFAKSLEMLPVVGGQV